MALRTNRLSYNDSTGFTFLEVIVVLLILGIISAVVIAKTVSTDSEQALTEVRQVKAHLRYAQSRAMANNAPWGVRLNNASTYWLFETTDTNRRMLPGQIADAVRLAELTLSGTPHTITFDGYGSPGADTITVQTSSNTITVTANTGYIP
jgi:MSHA pilin protein MshC